MSLYDLMGWRGDLAEQAFRQLQYEFIPFQFYGDPLTKPGTPIWEYAKLVNRGQHLPNLKQETGDCVSFGMAQAGQYLSAYEIAKQRQEEIYRPWFPPFIYGVSRTASDCGNNQLRGQAGSTGSWAAVAVKKYGILFADDQRVPPYSKQVADHWGDSGPPREFFDTARGRPVRSAARLRTVNEIRAALINYKTCTIASMRGFEMQAREYKGYHVFVPSGTWPHQMCIPPDSIVSAPIPKEAVDVQVGDEVYGHDGLLHKVTAIHEREYFGPMIVLKVSGLPRIHLTESHPVLVFKQGDRRFCVGTDYRNRSEVLGEGYEAWIKDQPVWVEAKDIRPGDYVVYPITSETREPTPDSLSSLALADRLEVSWFFGLYAADGDSTAGHRLRITLSANQMDLAERCQRVAQLLGASSCSIKDHGRFIRVCIYGSALSRLFIEWFGHGVNQKHLPGFILNGDWDLQQLLLGYIDGDGTAYRGSYQCRSVSKQLIDQIRQLVLLTGGEPYVHQVQCHIYQDNPSWSTLYSINWMIDPKGKTKFCRRFGDYWCMPVRSTTTIHHQGTVLNFEVEDAQSYIASGIVVHNCLIAWMDEPFPAAYRLNSWSAEAHGPPLNGEPPGGAWNLAEHLEQELKSNDVEVYAISAFEGFKGEADLGIL